MWTFTRWSRALRSADGRIRRRRTRRLERVLRACRQIAPEQRVMQPLPALDVACYARLLARLADDRPDFVLRRRPVRARASSDWRTAIMPGCTDSLASAHLLSGVGEGSIITVIVGRIALVLCNLPIAAGHACAHV